MVPHTLTITIMSHSTVPVSAKSSPLTLFTFGSIIHRQNLRFSNSRGNHRVSSRMAGSLHLPVVVSRHTDRLNQISLSNNHGRNHPIPTILITRPYCPDWNCSRQGRTSTLRKKPSPVVRVRRKRRKDVDCSRSIFQSADRNDTIYSVVWQLFIRQFGNYG